MAPPIEGKKKRKKRGTILLDIFLTQSQLPNGVSEFVQYNNFIYQYVRTIGNIHQYRYVGAGSQQQQESKRAGSQLAWPKRTYSPGAVHWGNARVGQSGNQIR